MLTPIDVMAAKLLVQVGDITPDQAREQLRTNSRDADREHDLVSRFAQRGLLEAPRPLVRRTRASSRAASHEEGYRG